MNSWIELDLRLLSSNIRRLRDALAPSTEIIFVVKANAYGHGVVPVARRALEAGTRWFAVAHINEAIELRSVLGEAGILVVGAIDASQAGACVEGGFVPVVTGFEHGRRISDVLAARGARLRYHAKVDTGMGRLGMDWQSAVADIAAIGRLGNLELSGVCTHFASAAAAGRKFFDIQRQRFAAVLEALAAAGIDPGFRHASNSGATMLEPAADFDGVRPGIMLYGYGGSDGARLIESEPVLQWKTRVVQVKHVPAGVPVGYDSTYVTPRETVIATVDVGYSDGYVRALSNRGQVLIRGQRMPVAGRVTMNLITVDAGLHSGVREGDTVVLIGRDGEAEIWADELAQLAGTISYEILTGIKPGRRENLQ